MNFTLSDCISRINQALNYPSISYEDVSHFFDQAIAELNTSLRIALPTVTEMRLEHTFKVSENPSTVVLTTTPSAEITVVNTPADSTPEPTEGSYPVLYYIDPRSNINNTFYIWKNQKWVESRKAYGIVSGGRSAYVAIPVADTCAVWSEIPFETVQGFSLTEYLPTDWIILFLIPYVCFKFAVRNGDNGALFSDEFTQGFQQLQTSYSVPNNVELSTVAHLPAYKNLVTANLNNLRKMVPVRAITESMRIRNGVRAVYGSNLFDNGGWGI